MSSLDRPTGEKVNDRYVLDRQIGRGTSGVVYRAQDADGTWVAVKLVMPDLSAEKGAVRYLRGARLAAQLQHPHIVRILDSGRWEGQSGGYFLAMELVEGVSLGVLKHLGLPARMLVGMMTQLLDAMVHVHARGTVHRDLKPDNILVSRDPTGRLRCHITDFGIAANRLQDASVTMQGSVLGTPAYMAPEQAQGLPSAGAAADLYAIGTIFYELLSRQRPFEGNVQAILYEKTHRDPPPLPNAAELPPGLDEVVLRLIARQPEERFFDARAAWEAVRPYADVPRLSLARWNEVLDVGAERDRIFHGDGASTGGAECASGSDTWNAEQTFNEELFTFSDVTEPVRLWGRQSELSRIEAIAEEAEQGEGQVILLEGGVGLGKSALMEELAIRMQEQGRFQVFSTAFSQINARDGGLRGLILKSLGVRSRSSSTVALAVAEHLRRFACEDPVEQEALSTWLMPELASKGEPTAAPALRYLRRMAQLRPVMVLLDDLHKGGGDSASLVEFLLFELGFEPCALLVVGAVNPEEWGPEFSEGLQRSAHAEGRSRHRVKLGPLSTMEIVDGLVGRYAASHAMAERVAREAGGNPLVAMGLAQAMNEGMEGTDPTMDTAGQIGSMNPALEMGLRRILKTLSGESALVHQVLGAMAILADEVDVSILADFVDLGLYSHEFEEALDRLIAREVIEEVRSDDQDLVALKPRALGHVLLAEMGSRQRRRLHQRALHILLERDEAWPGAIGNHHAQLGDMNAAIKSWRLAELDAWSAGAPFAASEWGLKVMEALPEPEASREAIRLGRLLLDAGDPMRAESVLRHVVMGSDPGLVIPAADVMCDVYENIGKGQEWTDLVRRVEEMLPSAGREARQAGLCAIAMWRTSHGDDVAGLAAAEDALAISETPRERRRAAQRVAFSCLPSGQLERAAEAAFIAVENSGDRLRHRVYSLRTFGVVRMWQGFTAEAIEVHEETLELARAHGLSSRAAVSLQDLADALRVAGRYAEAKVQYEASIAAATALDLTSTVYLVRFKAMMCDIATSVDPALEARVHALVQPASAAGLGLAVPFAALLTAWIRARTDQVEGAKQALAGAAILEQFRADPQVPMIFAEVRERIGG